MFGVWGPNEYFRIKRPFVAFNMVGHIFENILNQFVIGTSCYKEQCVTAV